MTALDRLLAEELPTGQVPDYRSGTTAARTAHTPWTPEEQARHRADLLAALDEKPLRVGRRARPVRHLAAVPPAA
ncbi:hypothetical protein RVR_8272 [Actinacidiphila reveromycinica]|uniref:Uncharacterized protein n=1 Tax=Actinacidiphila reveromycinica TaxID=659352 RepID=A0A7U3UYG8_9ACTN|nr:hypothetical protein [Streptomyces sp. SN-593]BBB01040.1 hypothetical protein RVR_8272 [Streptomyces sp. SN-593]